MTKKARKAKPEDQSPPYDLEYRAKEDDAWYSVSVVFDSDAQTLTVKYLCFPEVFDVVFLAGGFETEVEAGELVRRFRPLSQQVQDYQCGKLAIGTTVCAAHGTAEDDLRFYDAVIEAKHDMLIGDMLVGASRERERDVKVNHQDHSFAGGEEECLCTFVLFWLHGRGRGTLTSTNIASICTLERVSQVDPRISAFWIYVLQSFGSGSKGHSSDNKNSHISIEKNLESFRSGLLEVETSTTSKSLMWQSKDSWRISNYEHWTSQDEDIGPHQCNIDSLATGNHEHFILIDNLEKDLTPSSIKKFIYKKTTVLPQAFVFPRHLSDPCARGAIVVNCQKKVQIVYDFLANPNHLIVSSRGRYSSGKNVFATNIIFRTRLAS